MPNCPQNRSIAKIGKITTRIFSFGENHDTEKKENKKWQLIFIIITLNLTSSLKYILCRGTIKITNYDLNSYTYEKQICKTDFVK